MRVISAQKLPSVCVCARAKPRNTANATAMPVAADRKLCGTSANICDRLDSVDSPEYACQLVFVTKLIAVFIARSALNPGNPRGLSGSTPCRRSTA